MEHESSWIFAIEENELQENSANMLFPKGLPVLLIKKAGEIYAMSNKCEHMACALAGGTLKDFIIKCLCHDWRYDVDKTWSAMAFPSVRIGDKIVVGYNPEKYSERGHTNAPLEMGTLEGYILTCPLHHSQFDITTGEVLSGPVPADLGEEPIPESLMRYFQYVAMLLSKVKTYDLETYPVKIEGNSIAMDVD